jgi:hypothetical protein
MAKAFSLVRPAMREQAGIVKLFFYRQGPLDRYVAGILGYLGSDTFRQGAGFLFGRDPHNSVEKELDVFERRIVSIFRVLPGRFSSHDSFL